jgi:sortase A
MYALTYKKKHFYSKLFSIINKHKWISLVLLLGTVKFSGGVYIFAKANVAQYLIAQAWYKNLQSNQQYKPWPWADTHPVAELIIKDQHWFVLAGASGRNLAFAPTHVSATVIPGEVGNSVIVGHRDTQFNSLKYLKKGDLIEVKTAKTRQQFKVSMLRIADQSQMEYMQDVDMTADMNSDQPMLTLITCYPFDSLVPDPTHRYIVRAVAI